MVPRNLITGVTGQDGSLLAERLVSRGENVTGLFRRSSGDNLWRLRKMKIIDKIDLVECEIASFSDLGEIFRKTEISTVFHLAGSSFTAESFHKPLTTFSLNTSAVFSLCEAVQRFSPATKVILAGSSEVFGHPENDSVRTVNSGSKFNPVNPYGISHAAILNIANYFRTVYALNITCPIMFNHESIFRGEQFLSRKISMGVAKYALGASKPIELGNLNASKDWGCADDFIGVLVKLSEAAVNSGVVVGTGTLTTVRQIVSAAFDSAGIAGHFEGSGLNEKFIDSFTGKDLVTVNPNYFRTMETFPFVADITELASKLGESITLRPVLNIISEMVGSDLKTVVE